MKIKVRYEDQMTTIDVPEEDFTVMVQLDYQKRLANAEDPSSIAPRSPQEIIDERINRPDYNNWRKHWRHTDADPVPTSEGGTRFSSSFDTDSPEHNGGFTMDDFPDIAGASAQANRENYEALCEYLRSVLKRDYAEMMIAIHLDGMSHIEYAALVGDKPNNISHRLQRAEKKLKEILKKRPF